MHLNYYGTSGIFLALLLGCQHPSQPTVASFTENYKLVSRGKCHVEIPELYEMVNTCILLSDYNGNEHQKTVGTTTFGREVLKEFARFKDHSSVIAVSNQVKTINDNYAVRDSSYSYKFDNNGKIVPSGIYKNLVNYQQDKFAKLIPLFEKFASDTGFRRYFAAKSDFFLRKQRTFEQMANVESIWKWLEGKFPERIDSYRVICSPLTGANHRTCEGKDQGFREILMFVSGPMDKRTFTRLDQSELQRMVFTEIDHNYVNPMTTKLGTVNESLGNWKKWGGEKSSYSSQELVFNEYQTFALFTLYSHDTFPKEPVNVGINATEVLMKQRGFSRFPEYNQFLLSYYRANPSSTGYDLARVGLKWFKTH